MMSRDRKESALSSGWESFNLLLSFVNRPLKNSIFNHFQERGKFSL